MALQDKQLEEIVEADLQALIDGGVAEGKEIDFKRDSYGNAEADRREYLADISSLANTAGGHLVIGMTEVAGVVSTKPGLTGNPDVERGRLEQMARDGLQPRISGLAIQPIPLANGNFVVVIRVPKSWDPPHRVIFQRSNRFWARSDGGKFEPDVDQLRQLFQTAPALADRIRSFRADRIGKVISRETAAPIAERSAYVLHVLPFAAFDGQARVSMTELNAQWVRFRPLEAMGLSHRINLDGILTYTGQDMAAPAAFTQVWRDGRIEAVRSPLVRPAERDFPPRVFGRTIEAYFVDALVGYLTGLRELGIGPPFAVFATLLGVKGAHLAVPQGGEDLYLFDRDVVNTSEVVCVDYFVDEQAVAAALRPTFDEIAHAAGRTRSYSYDAEGRWARQR